MQYEISQNSPLAPILNHCKTLLIAVTAGTINYHRSQGPQQLATVVQLVITPLFALTIHLDL
jgi:hypothetical protein